MSQCEMVSIITTSRRMLGYHFCKPQPNYDGVSDVRCEREAVRKYGGMNLCLPHYRIYKNGIPKNYHEEEQ